MWSLASLLLLKCSSDLKYSPCPPTRNWGSRVFGLVFFFAVLQFFFFVIGPAHSHATWKAMIPSLLTFKCKFLHHCPFQNAVFTHFTTPRRIFVFNISYTLLHSIVSADKFWARWIIFVGQIIDWCIKWMFHIKGYL